MPISLWSNVGVSVQSALGTANTITAISKASPGVVTYSGADPSNGAYVYMTVQGMNQVDGRVFRVAGVDAGANTFQLEGEDTTSYSTFSSGSFQVITYGTTITSLTGLSSGGGDFNFVDVTTIHDSVARQIPGLANPATYTFESFWDVSDAGLVALKAASDSQAVRAVLFSFANGQKVAFAGYVGATLLPGGQAQDKVTTSVVITMYGRPSVFAS
jgi:hypothetical protein